MKTRTCLCKCETEERDRLEAERKQRELDSKIKRLKMNGFPESKMREWTFEADDGKNEKLITAAKNFVKNFDEFRRSGKGLILYGGVGTGKTFAAACIANALMDKGIPVLMTNFARIANTIQGMYEGKQEYYDNLNRYPLLILDDLAAERKTEFMQEIVFNVIDNRCRAGLPLIITSNLTGAELKNPADMTNKRIYSRVLEICHPLEVEGTDRRRESLKNDFERTKNLLGI